MMLSTAEMKISKTLDVSQMSNHGITSGMRASLGRGRRNCTNGSIVAPNPGAAPDGEPERYADLRASQALSQPRADIVMPLEANNSGESVSATRQHRSRQDLELFSPIDGSGRSHHYQPLASDPPGRCKAYGPRHGCRMLME